MQQYYSNVVGIIVLRRSTIVGNCITNVKKKKKQQLEITGNLTKKPFSYISKILSYI